jgi:hypothetical protein
MKSYLITTGLLFGLLTVLHVWRAVAEWPHPAAASPGFVLGMAALIVVPGVLSWWAWRLLRTLSDDRAKLERANGGG